MRRALNENPVAQVVFIGILVIVVGFLFVTRIAAGEEEAAAPAETASAAPTLPASTAAATAAPVPSGAPAVPVGPSQGFVAGPGLPADVVRAYRAGKTVVLLIVRERGIDDRKVEAALESARRSGGAEVALFVTRAKAIARYSRITQGVEVERVPAMVVISPKRLTEGELPEASVSYGYRGAASIAQAVRDANYAGRDDLPYFPG